MAAPSRRWSARLLVFGAGSALLLSAAFAAVIRPAHAATESAFTVPSPVLTVTTVADGHLDPGATSCVSSGPPAFGRCTLRAAFELAPILSVGVVIKLGEGRFQLTLGSLTTSDVAIALTGAGPSKTIVLGDGAHRVFDNPIPELQMDISGLRISNGAALEGDGLGGGILNAGTMSLTNVDVEGNVAVTGGGIADFGTLFLDPGVVVTGNTARGDESAQRVTGIGGGIAEFGTLTASAAVLAANQSGFHGGNLAVSSSVTPDGHPATRGTAKVESTTIGDGRAGSLIIDGGGGGAFIDNGDSASFVASTFTGNDAGALAAGGAIFDCGALTLTNDTLAANLARSGGAIAFDPGCSGPPAVIAPPAVQQLLLPRSTGGVVSVARINAPRAAPTLAAFASPGVDLDFVTIANPPETDGAVNAGVDGDVFRARNSIIASCSFRSEITSLGHNLENGNTCGLNKPGDKVNTDPKLGPLQDNGGPTFTMALAAGTPAVDAADPACGVPVDQRGISRPQGAACDIGAYELQVPLSRLPLPPMTGATRSSPPAAALLAALLVLSLTIAGSLWTLIQRYGRAR